MGVKRRFQRSYLMRLNAQRRPFDVVGRRGQIGAQVEKIVLHLRQQLIDLSRRMQARQADGGIAFVDAADGDQANIVLGPT
jgi:hypothetical protein